MKIFRIFLILFFFPLIAFNQNKTADAIQLSLKNGNSSNLSKYFNTNIELTIIDKQDIYSKTQAEGLLKDFFTKNIPSSFSIIHKGGKEDAQYYVGKLQTSTGTYRVSYLLKGEDQNAKIHQLRIEKNDE